MDVRPAVRAGSFYEAAPSVCRRDAEKLIGAADLPDDLPSPLYGGLVPHAGWVYSGKVAAMTLKALSAGGLAATFVLFGADHTGAARFGEVYDRGAWQSPLGRTAIDEELAAALLAVCNSLRSNPTAHALEHSIEVQVPLLAALREDVRIVPIAVPATPAAVEIGRAVGDVLAERFPAAAVVGSTDLTHHGGHFGSQGGRGKVGEQWTRKNDHRMLELIETMDAERIVLEAREHMNACGAGAIAATIAACRCLGASRGICLEYTNSYEITHAARPDYPDDTTVGYASVVFA